MQYLSRRCEISPSVLPPSKPRRGAIAVFEALILGTLSLALATATGEWFVNINAPCDSGTGTQTNPFCNIMDAVNVASSGDTIHIAPGTYRESLVLDKDLTLIGTEGDDVTIVEGQLDSVVRPQNGTTIEIDGLTLTGGGLVERGGGVFIDNFAQPATVVLANSTVSGNRASNIAYNAKGGGIYNGNGTLVLTDSTVSGNSVYNSAYDAMGGGIYNGNGTLLLTDSTVSENTVSTSQYNAYGGGIHNRNGTLLLVSSTVSNNNASSTIRGAAFGGGIFSSGGSASLHNSAVIGNLICGNYFAGGSAISATPLTLDNCTVSQNASLFITASAVRGFDLEVTSSIVWGNRAGFGPPSASIEGAGTVNHSDVMTGWTGAGANNIQLDPLFVDPLNGNFTLQATSPCIDAGDPSLSPSGRDLGGNPRFLDGDLNRVMVVDMGAHEFDNVQLAVTGNATPGGTLTFDTTGTTGMLVFLAIATTPGELLVPPFGSLFFDLGSPWSLVPMGTIPNTVNMMVPPTVPSPTQVIFQEFAIGPPLPGGKSPGNFSKPVSLTIE